MAKKRNPQQICKRQYKSADAKEQQHFHQSSPHKIGNYQQQNNQNSQSQQGYILLLEKPCLQKRKLSQVTQEIIFMLKQKISKEIIHLKFQQTNSCLDIAQIQLPNYTSQPQTPKKQTQLIRASQIQIINDFIQSPSLEIPKHFKPINQKQSVKSKFVNFQFIMLDIANLKFLNIYGSPGVGKTYTLKNMINQSNIKSNIIWINGMSINNGKSKRTITNVNNTFQQMLKNQLKNIIDKTAYQTLTQQKQKILIIDQYDQIQNFKIQDLVRYAYISNRNQTLIPYRISKVILISNQQSSILPNINKQQLNYHIQNIVFVPFTTDQIQTIIKKKIQTVNSQFLYIISRKDKQSRISLENSYNFQLLSLLFQNKICGVFSNKDIRLIIKRVSYPQQNDIRKVLNFYCLVFDQWVQQLSQELNKLSIQELQRSNGYLISEKYLQAQAISICCPQVRQAQCPLLSYVSQIANEGRLLLQRLLQTLKQKKFSEKKPHNQSQTISHHILESWTQKQLNNSMGIRDVMRKKFGVKEDKAFLWIWEFQQAGILKVVGGREQPIRFYYHPQHNNTMQINNNFRFCLINVAKIKRALGQA